MQGISNTSPLLYLYRGGVIDWLPHIFSEVWIPHAVLKELEEGLHKGYDVPNPQEYTWIKIVDPQTIPSEWLALDLGTGELAAMALALENPKQVILLDDAMARRIAQAAGLNVWGTLKVLLEAKARRLTESIAPVVSRMESNGMWISANIRRRILTLAEEAEEKA